MANDEAEQALTILEKALPGYYRDHTPKPVADLKRLIQKQLMTSADYIKNPYDNTLIGKERSQIAVETQLRGVAVKETVKKMNDNGQTPHIFDMGPGEYWLAIGLKELNLKFTYQAAHVNPEAERKAKALVPDLFQDPDEQMPLIFNACEIIEHLFNPWEIPQTAAKLHKEPDWVFMSTPKYTFSENLEWDDPKHTSLLGHLRTYTPSEFTREAYRMFSGYTWTYYDSAIMLLVGEKITNGKR